MRILRRSVCLLAALLPMTAAATPVTYEFSGFVSSGFLPDGTEVSGSFSYDDSTLPTESAMVGDYYDDAVTGFTANFGAGGALLSLQMAAGAESRLHLRVDPHPLLPILQDTMQLVTDAAPVPGAAANTHWQLHFIGGGANDLFPSGFTLLDPLPVESMDRSYLQVSFFTLDDQGSQVDQGLVLATLTSIVRAAEPTPVPEPSAFWLGAALLPLAMMRRKFPARR